MSYLNKGSVRQFELHHQHPSYEDIATERNDQPRVLQRCPSPVLLSCVLIVVRLRKAICF